MHELINDANQFTHNHAYQISLFSVQNGSSHISFEFLAILRMYNSFDFKRFDHKNQLITMDYPFNAVTIAIIIKSIFFSLALDESIKSIGIVNFS